MWTEGSASAKSRDASVARPHPSEQDGINRGINRSRPKPRGEGGLDGVGDLIQPIWSQFVDLNAEQAAMAVRNRRFTGRCSVCAFRDIVRPDGHKSRRRERGGYRIDVIILWCAQA